MKIAAVIARILLGLAFLAAGGSGFFLIAHPPPAPPGLAGTFQDVFFQSRWVLFVDVVEFVSGALLLANRFVPLAIVMLAGVLSNILAFHVTMMPSGLPVPLLLTACWFIVAYRFRSYFWPLLVQSAEPTVEVQDAGRHS